MAENKRTEDLEELKVYSLTEIEPILGVTHRTLLTYIKDGRLKGVKIGGKWKVSGENLKKFVNGES
jgi:excisionase family DNA binding protein